MDDRQHCFIIWWRDLESDPGGRAALRRCGDPLAAMMLPAYHRLVRRAASAGFQNRERLAVAAAVLSHVRSDHAAHSFARALGDRLAEARFRRAMTIDDPRDLLVPLIRMVRFNQGSAPIESLGRDIQFWGAAVKQRWAFDYYDKEISA